MSLSQAWKIFTLCLLQLTVIVGWLLLLQGCGKGSSGPSEPPPPTPISLSYSTTAASLTEGTNDSLQVVVSTTTPVDRFVTASIRLSGTAVRNADYEIDSTSLSFRFGQSQASTTIRVLKDWIVEENETFTVEVFSTGEAITVTGQPIDISITDSAVGPVSKAEFDSFAFAFGNMDVRILEVVIEATLYNVGRSQLPPARLVMFLTEAPYFGTSRYTRYTANINPLNAFSRDSTFWTIPLSDLKPNQTYYIQIAALDRNSPSLLHGYSRDWLGFETDAYGYVKVRCLTPIAEESAEGVDPLQNHQWSLQNRGQRAFARGGGVRDADLSMDQVLSTGVPDGEGIEVAVVDTGLEVCHPDLAANIDPFTSINFKSADYTSTSWFGAFSNDPFQVSTYGDHGTAVAGIIAARGNNGIGLRGVAPAVSLRGFNYLENQCCLEDALGGSPADPQTDDVDIFNLSWGTSFSAPGVVSTSANQLYRTMTETLRDGKGAVYVKAAGNSFNACFSKRHEVHDQIGCQTTNNEAVQVLPYLIAVGALNADDERASYSSTGSTLWVSAPAGQWGNSAPASITTDQVGTRRGYDQISQRGLALDSTANPDGNYISTFNGTSAAAPHASGAIALLLDKQPSLTWRDVKHVLASTARQVQSHLLEERVAIGGAPITLLDAWVENAAGYTYHNHFGFGAIDIDAALRFLDTYTSNGLGTFRESVWFTAPLGEDSAIPDERGTGLTLPVRVSTLATDNTVETVWVRLQVDHSFPADLAITLTSPQGTRSVIHPPLNNNIMVSSSINAILGSNAFYGEDPNGVWRLNLADVVAGDVGSVTRFELKVFMGQH